MNQYEKVAKLISNSKNTVILTGAGISTESGIPDFRSPGSGLWERIDPIEELSVNVLYNNPNKFYKTGFRLLMTMKNALPNKAHYLITKLEEMGLLNIVITQNIDNLHYKAETKNIYEVHGNTRTCTCLSCKNVSDISIIENKIQQNEIPPKCSCGGVLRPDVILFGDSLPDCFYYGIKMTKDADLLIVAGSSLSVSPVNYLAEICKQLVILNIGETYYDYKSSIIIREPISKSLGKIMEYINK